MIYIQQDFYYKQRFLNKRFQLHKIDSIQLISFQYFVDNYSKNKLLDFQQLNIVIYKLENYIKVSYLNEI